MKFIVGLTGGIGSGKSVASDEFRHYKISVVDADIVARQVVEPNTDALKKIEQHFGQAILLPNKSLDRKGLREIIFHNPVEKQWLEKLLHPIIRETIKHQLTSATSPYAILVSPLLLETDQHKLTHRILVIDAAESLQIERACARDQSSKEQIQSIMSTQLERSARLAKADDVLHNHGDLNELKTQIAQLHQHYLQLAQ